MKKCTRSTPRCTDGTTDFGCGWCVTLRVTGVFMDPKALAQALRAKMGGKKQAPRQQAPRELAKQVARQQAPTQQAPTQQARRSRGGVVRAGRAQAQLEPNWESKASQIGQDVGLEHNQEDIRWGFDPEGRMVEATRAFNAFVVKLDRLQSTMSKKVWEARVRWTFASIFEGWDPDESWETSATKIKV